MRKSIEALVTGQQDAANKFMNFVVDAIECDDIAADTLLRFYLKNKLIKLDPIMRSYNVRHGGLLDTEVLEKALLMATGKLKI